jgi:transposase, IS5 family
LKCLLLQKWFRIGSDPELETQINDRISFKKFLGLSIEQPSPDQSMVSRFRDRLSAHQMILLNDRILQEFEKRGLRINEGIAVNVRLVESASKPLSNDGIRKEKEKRETSEGKLDKNDNALKFSRDVESDWTVNNDKAHYGLKEHASVDVENGFILATTMTPASIHDTKYLSCLTLASCHSEEPIKKVYADKGYYGEPNRSFLNLNDIEDGIMRKDTTLRNLRRLKKTGTNVSQKGDT